MMIHFGGVANDNCDIHNSIGMNMKHLNTCLLKLSTLLNLCNHVNLHVQSKMSKLLDWFETNHLNIQ